MPEYKLIYFNAKGRAELIRWIFAYGDIAYTDERIEWCDWPARKADIPGGKLPLLVVDDKTLPQSLAIARYLAKQAGLVPQDDLEAAFCDALADTLSEMMHEVYKIIFSPNDEEEKKRQRKEELFPNVISPILTRLNKQLEEREWLVSNEVTWADLMFGLVMGWLEKKDPEMLNGFPAIQQHVNKILALPKIKQWVEEQPDTAF
ncbi:hematopoietic prostaglandin D synthase-like [Panulirus ornatus]|uniref:hematopoietic prostaglandin D synthase-like n=1 Tax=Panulirus ornatus TaxID=150431 RepID=UPI003A8A1228